MVHVLADSPGKRVGVGYARAMTARLLASLLLLTCLTAGEDVQLPWIPSPLDDWPALQRAADNYATRTRAARRTLYPHPGDRFWDAGWHGGADIPKPPVGIGAEDLIVLDLMISTGSNSSQSGGQIVVWRGANGTAIGATVFFQWSQLAKSVPPLFVDEAAYLERLNRLVAEATPPSGAWKVDKGKNYWYAAWQRAGSQAATLDTSRGVAAELRPEERVWLSTAPRPMPVPAPPPVLDEQTYRTRVAGHAQVQAALKRAHGGYPINPVVVAGVEENKPAAANGWKLGDIIVSIDGHPLSDTEALEGLRSRKGGDNLFVMMRSDGTCYETRVKPGKQGFGMRMLASDPGLALLRLAPASEVDLAVACYACEDAALVATALRRLGGSLGIAASSYLNAWLASYAGDYGRSEALLTGKAIAAEPRLRQVAEDLLRANRVRSGRLLWAYPGFEQEGQHAMLLRHLLKDLTPAERFAVFDVGVPAQDFPESATDLVKPIHHASTVLLKDGLGTLLSTDDALTVEVRLDALPTRCRLDFEMQLMPTKLSHRGNMMESPVQQHVQLRFGLQSKSGFVYKGCGGVRVWLDGSIEVAGASLDRDEWDLAWHTVPGRVHSEGTGWNTITMIRIGQLQRIEVNGRAVLNAFLPLAAGEAAGQHVALEVENSALQTPIRGFRVSMPKPPAKVSDF